MSNPGFTKSFLAEGAVVARRFVKFGTTDKQVKVATAATDKTIGVNEKLDGADGQLIDTIMSDTAELVLGGAVTAGDSLVPDAAGAGVTGATGNIAGAVALATGVAGDIIDVKLGRHTVA